MRRFEFLTRWSQLRAGSAEGALLDERDRQLEDYLAELAVSGDWGGQWVAWTSTTFTNITGGVISGAYIQVGKTLLLRGGFTAGTVTAAGTWSITLPVLGTAAGRHLIYGLQSTTICSGLIASGGTTITFSASNTSTASTFGAGASLTNFTFNGVINLA